MMLIVRFLIVAFILLFFKNLHAQEALVVYAVLSDYAKNVAAEFSSKTGFEVKVIPTRGSGETLARLELEKLNTTADVWFGGSIGAHGQAFEKGLIEPYKSQHHENLLALFRDPLGSNRVNGLYAGVLGFAVNKNLLKTKKHSIPRKWDDLLSTKYHSNIGMKKPTISGTAYTTLSTVIALKGEEPALEYFKRLHLNIWEYTTGQTERVIRGDVAIAITFLHELAFYKNKEFVEFVIPEDGSSYEIGGISLIKYSKNKGIAKKFIDFSLSHEGQLIKYFTNNQLSTHIKTSEMKNEFDSVKGLMSLDYGYFGRNRQRLSQAWYSSVFPE